MLLCLWGTQTTHSVHATETCGDMEGIQHQEMQMPAQATKRLQKAGNLGSRVFNSHSL